MTGHWSVWSMRRSLFLFIAYKVSVFPLQVDADVEGAFGGDDFDVIQKCAVLVICNLEMLQDFVEFESLPKVMGDSTFRLSTC